MTMWIIQKRRTEEKLTSLKWTDLSVLLLTHFMDVTLGHSYRGGVCKLLKRKFIPCANCVTFEVRRIKIGTNTAPKNCLKLFSLSLVHSFANQIQVIVAALAAL